jgi:hypothetical protein
MLIVPAAGNSIELLVESLEICVILLLVFVSVFLAAEAVLSTLVTYVDSFVLNSSQVEAVGCNDNKNDGTEPKVIELLDVDEDDDDEEVSLDEEDDDDNDEDEVMYMGTFRATTAPERPRKMVSFGNVQVQEYSVTLGDHPCCEGGYPLSLDWAHTDVVEYSLDWYEETKPEGACAELSAEQRKRRIENVTGVNPVVLEWKEEHRLLKLADGKQDASEADSVDDHADGCASEKDLVDVDDDDDDEEDEAFILGTF